MRKMYWSWESGEKGRIHALILTETEDEVFHGLAEGMANKEMAERFHISIDALRSRLRHLYGKLGTSDRARVRGIAKKAIS